MRYPYRPRKQAVESTLDFYILYCGHCQQPRKHLYSKDHTISYHEVDGISHGRSKGKAIDHLYKCDQCGSVRRYGLTDEKKVERTCSKTDSKPIDSSHA